MMCSVFIFQLQRIFPRQLVPQAVVDALLCQQLVMGAGLHDALFAQHKDAVVVLDGGQAVGDGQGGAAMGQLLEALAWRKASSLRQRLPY